MPPLVARPRQAGRSELPILQVRRAFLHGAYLGHGDVYDETARYLTTAQKAAIRNRDRGLCVRCGNPGVEVDHIEGHSDDPSNLQLLCLDCHHAKTRQSMSTITDAADRQAIRTMHAELANRVDSIIPIRACDNEQTWGTAWRSWPNVTAKAFAYDQLAADLRFADLLTVVAGAANIA